LPWGFAVVTRLVLTRTEWATERAVLNQGWM
jgi:hypothetical protein